MSEDYYIDGSVATSGRYYEFHFVICLGIVMMLMLCFNNHCGDWQCSRYAVSVFSICHIGDH